jgi:hypothetical protein
MTSGDHTANFKRLGFETADEEATATTVHIRAVVKL